MKLIPILSSYAQAAVELSKRCFSRPTPSDYERLDRHIRRLEGMAREAFQEEYRKRYEALALKLEQGQPLTQDEKHDLELLIIGEAQYYLKTEQDFEAWQHELHRLIDEIEKLEKDGFNDVEAFMHLQALCRDARGVLPNITFYMREQERVKQFKSRITGDLDQETARILADLIRSMLHSEAI